MISVGIYRFVVLASMAVCIVLGYLIRGEMLAKREDETDFHILELSTVQKHLFRDVGEERFSKAVHKAFVEIMTEAAADGTHSRQQVREVIEQDRQMRAMAQKYQADYITAINKEICDD